MINLPHLLLPDLENRLNKEKDLEIFLVATTYLGIILKNSNLK